MKKLYEWMRRYQDPNEDRHDFIERNLYKQTKCVRQWLDQGTYTLSHFKPAFDAEYYADTLDQYYLDQGLTRQQVKEWIQDPEYEILIKQVGLQVQTEAPPKVIEMFQNSVHDVFPIHWDTAQILIHVQRPGDMFPLHYDRYKNCEFDAHGKSVQRWLIMLYDQQPGQCFFMNNHSISWKAGDVIGWDQVNYSHGSANFGFYPRFSIRLTGVMLDQANPTKNH